MRLTARNIYICGVFATSSINFGPLIYFVSKQSLRASNSHTKVAYVTEFLQTGLFLGFFSREIVQHRAACVRVGKVKQWRPHVHMSTQ